jgi:hypothetical protein
MYINFHLIISIYKTHQLLLNRVRCQQNLSLKTSILTLKCTVAYNDIYNYKGGSYIFNYWLRGYYIGAASYAVSF